jgi:hypothetical protein
MKTGLLLPKASYFPGGSHWLSEAVRFILVPYHLPPLRLERSDAICALFLNVRYTISTNQRLLNRSLLQTGLSLARPTVGCAVKVGGGDSSSITKHFDLVFGTLISVRIMSPIM